MGGFGSGRPSGSGRGTVEDCRLIDVNRLHKTGCLRAGWVGGCQWTRDGEKVASINLRAETDRLHLSYRVRVGGGEWEDVDETVRIVRAACRFGGARPYNALKAAVINYMSNLATQLAPKNIRANTVSPGTIYFDDGVWGKRKQEAPASYAAALAQNPMGRMGTPEEVAKAVAFIASPAASFITGANLVVDGGFTRRVQY